MIRKGSKPARPILPCSGAGAPGNIRGLNSQDPHPQEPDLPAARTPTARQRWKDSNAWRWAFRFAAILAVPWVILAAFEGALRFAGYGYATAYFVPQTIRGEPWLVANPWFGLRFFPPAVARSPSPVLMRADKPAGSVRIFLFGESAAMGDPRPGYGVGRCLETLLRERVPGVEFEVVTTAMTAINSHAILPIARECAGLEGDLWIVYMGNNEMTGPFGPNSVLGVRAPPLWVARSVLTAQKTRVGQWLMAAARTRARSGADAAWGGLGMFQNSQVAPDDDRKVVAYEAFRLNLEGILRAAARARVPVILSSVASNLKDCPPFASMHGKSDRAVAPELWQTRFDEAKSAAAQGNWAVAEILFSEALDSSPSYAESHFRLGDVLLKASRREAARASFEEARNCDALGVRADARINQLAREAARAWARRRVSWVDAEQVLAASSDAGIPGEESFDDHVHLNFEGNYRLAAAFGEEVLRQLPAPAVKERKATWASPEECARRLGLTVWNRCAALEEMIERLAEAPFTNQIGHAARLSRMEQRLGALRKELQPERREAARKVYEEAVAARPGDSWLHQGYAEFLMAIGDLAQASVQMAAVRDLRPHHHAAYLHLGRLLARQQRFDEARAAIERALQLRPGLWEAMVELVQVCAGQGKLDEAHRACDQAGNLRPNDPAVHVLRARLFEMEDQRDRAIESLREALRIQPSSWDARYLLGLQLLLARDFAEAEMELAEAVRARPDFAPGRLNLGFALAQQHRFDEAVPHFREALRLEPGNAQAREFLQTAERIANANRAR